ncbi:MAG: hypothetical protein ACRDTX_21230 [Pseudonocardiaceae bacterium]
MITILSRFSVAAATAVLAIGGVLALTSTANADSLGVSYTNLGADTNTGGNPPNLGYGPQNGPFLSQAAKDTAQSLVALVPIGSDLPTSGASDGSDFLKNVVAKIAPE